MQLKFTPALGRRWTLTYLSPRAIPGVAERRRLRLRPAHKRGGPGSGASEPERLRINATWSASRGAGRVEWKP